MRTLVALLFSLVVSMMTFASHAAAHEASCTVRFAVDNITAETVGSTIDLVETNCHTEDTLELYVTSYGGDPDAAAAIYEYLRERGNVHTIAAGPCASSCIPIYLSGDHRSIQRFGYLLVHPIRSSGNDGELEWLQEGIRGTQISRETYAEIISERTGLEREQVDQIIAAHTYMTAKDEVAKNLHFVTE